MEKWKSIKVPEELWFKIKSVAHQKRKKIYEELEEKYL